MTVSWHRGIVHALIGFFAGAAGVSEYDLGYEACRQDMMKVLDKMQRRPK